MGSKNKIADWVVKNLPAAPVLVDLFAGGGAITHCATLSGNWGRVISNDIDGTAMQLYADAVAGKYANETRWVSREDFFRLKDTDPYVRWCWSFGTAGENYMYSVEIEPWKKALHMARAFGDTSMLRQFGIMGDGSRADVVAHHDEYREKYIRWWLSVQEYNAEELDSLIAQTKEDVAKSEEELRQYLLEGLRSSGLTQAEVQRRLGNQMACHYFCRSQWQFPTKEVYINMQQFMPGLVQPYDEVVGLHRLRQSLQSLQSLQHLQRLQRLQNLPTPEVSCCDYEAVNLPAGAVIYCDIPYRGVEQYNETEFDHARFYRWTEHQSRLVVISEYDMPADRFERVAVTSKISDMNGRGPKARKEEGLWVPRHQVELYRQMMMK